MRNLEIGRSTRVRGVRETRETFLKMMITLVDNGREIRGRGLLLADGLSFEGALEKIARRLADVPSQTSCAFMKQSSLESACPPYRHLHIHCCRKCEC